MSCAGAGFSLVWTAPWGGAASVPSAGGQQCVQASGAVADGDVAVFADATGTKVRTATAADVQAWLTWAASHVPIEGSELWQPVRFREVDGVRYLEQNGEPVAAPWA
jgi:hypothetical protein